MSIVERPRECRSVIQENVRNSFTTHSGMIDFKGRNYFFYRNEVLPTGGSYCRPICVDDMCCNPDGTIQKQFKQLKA